MATFVLIHGSFQGGWIWQPTVECLRTAGHEVYAPTLIGCAERRHHLHAGVTFESTAREVADLLYYEDLQDVVLAGTSSGGFVMAKVAELARDRVSRLIFIDALAPQPGESVKDIVVRGPNAPPYEMTELTRGPSRASLEQGLFAEFEGEMKTWAVDRATAHPIAISDVPPGGLDAFWDQSWRATVIYCTQSENPREPHQRRTAEKLGADWLVMEAGHHPMLTHGDELAGLMQA